MTGFSNRQILIISEKNGTIISRSCFWKPLKAPSDQCYDSFTPSYIHNEACELCEEDGCNGAMMVQFRFTALFVIISTIVTMNSSVLHVLHWPCRMLPKFWHLCWTTVYMYDVSHINYFRHIIYHLNKTVYYISISP